jgi:hypothetical protein
MKHMKPGTPQLMPQAQPEPTSGLLAGLLNRLIFKGDHRILDPFGANTYGNSVTLKTPSAAIPATTGIVQVPSVESAAQTFTSIFDARARNPGSPAALTIAVGSPDIQFDTSGNPPGANFDLKGRIEWGTGGGRQQADFDIRDGQNVTVLGTYVRVSAIYSALTTAVGIPRVRMNGSISYGTRGGGQTPPTWTGTQVVDGGATAVFFIPPFAVDAVVYSYNATTGLSTAVIVQFGTSLVVNAPGGVISQPANDSRVYRIPHVVRELFVTNAEAMGTNVVNTVVFGLEL